MLFIINIRSNEDSTSANSLIIINADTLLPMKSFQVKDSSYEFTPDLYSHIAFRMNGELYFLASNIWNHFLMKFDYALNIVSTQVSFIQNYFNVTLTPSYYTHKYINGTLYWSSKRRYSFSENTYVYVTFLAKTDVFLNADLWSYNIFQSMHDYSVRNLGLILHYAILSFNKIYLFFSYSFWFKLKYHFSLSFILNSKERWVYFILKLLLFFL